MITISVVNIILIKNEINANPTTNDYSPIKYIDRQTENVIKDNNANNFDLPPYSLESITFYMHKFAISSASNI